MDKEKALAKKLYQVASLGFYLAALGFFAAAVIGRNLVYSPIGTAFMCVGTLFLVLSRRKNKKDGDSDNDSL